MNRTATAGAERASARLTTGKSRSRRSVAGGPKSATTVGGGSLGRAGGLGAPRRDVPDCPLARLCDLELRRASHRRPRKRRRDRDLFIVSLAGHEASRPGGGEARAPRARLPPQERG